MKLVPTTAIPPRIVREVIVRPGLETLIDSIDTSRVTIVCAPAGSGKTVAMLRWAASIREAGRPVLWLAGRAGIVDMTSFLAALRAAAEAGGLDVPSCADEPEAWLSCFAVQRERRPLLVIDDAQLLPAEALDFVSRLVASARDALTTMIGSRGSAAIPVARMRALGFLVEIGMHELRWSTAEAAELVTRVVGVPVNAAELQSVISEVEGWVSGLVIAGDLLRRDREQRHSGSLRPTDRRAEFADYFQEEVFDTLQQNMRNFVVDTSVLDELTPGACAAVIGAEDARALLDQAYAAGIFLEAIDREHSRYRYQRLFRVLVSGRLAERAPARAAELHRRASRYFADQGNLLDAIEHAAATRDPEFLADQLDRLAEGLTFNGYLYRLDELASELPPKLIASRPMLALTLAWRRTRRLAFHSADKLISAAEGEIAARHDAGALDASDLAMYDHIVRHRRIMLDAARDEMDQVEPAAERLLAEFGDDHPYLSCTVLAQLMSARRELYHFHDILRLEAETRKALGRPGSRFASIALKASVAPTLIAQGKTEIAKASLEEALVLAQNLQGDDSGLAALPAMPLAELLYEQGDLDGARRLVERYLPAVRQWGFVDQLASGFLVRARLAVASGDIASALAGLKDAHLIAIECGLSRLRAFVVNEQVRVLVRAGQVEEAEQAFLAGDPDLDGEPVPTLHPTRRNESVAIAWLRLATQRNRLVSARKVARRWLEFARRRSAVRSAVTFELLLAEIAVLQGNRSEARRAVRSAVELAEPAGWSRVFIDEGEVISSLLLESYGHGPALQTPADRFASGLVSLTRGTPIIGVEDEEFGLGSALAAREVDILAMVSGGLRNREVGDRLGLTEGTVKWYMQQIYDKLGVRRRPQAVMRARHLGLLP